MKKISEKGQAIAELLVMLVALTMIVLGLIYVGGITLNSNRLLLDARNQAQQLSRSAATDDANGREIAGWVYGSSLQLNDSKTIPFSANDRIVYESNGLLGSAGDDLAGQSHSDNTDFVWTNLNRKVHSGFDGDFSTIAETARSAAGLVSAIGDTQSAVYNNLDNGKKNPASGRTMRKTFWEWFGVKLDSDTLRLLPANRVYLPSLVK